MAGQLDALTWLINEVLDQGYEIKPEQFLITGTIGPMVPATPGRYSADFAQLGEIKVRSRLAVQPVSFTFEVTKNHTFLYGIYCL